MSQINPTPRDTHDVLTRIAEALETLCQEAEELNATLYELWASESAPVEVKVEPPVGHDLGRRIATALQREGVR